MSWVFTAAELGQELVGIDPELKVEGTETVLQIPLPGRGPIDALLVLHRPQASQELAS